MGIKQTAIMVSRDTFYNFANVKKIKKQIFGSDSVRILQNKKYKAIRSHDAILILGPCEIARSLRRGNLDVEKVRPHVNIVIFLLCILIYVVKKTYKCIQCNSFL